MSIINSISTPILKNRVVTDLVNRTQLNIKFNVAFNHDLSPNEDEHFKSRYGFKIEIFGYPNAEHPPSSQTDRNEQAAHLFSFERTIYRWVPSFNVFGGAGFWGNGSLVRTLTEIFDLSGEPNRDGPLGINKVFYVNQRAVSQQIEMDLLDVNPSVGTPVPGYLGGGVSIQQRPDLIFARILIVDKRTRAVVGTKDSKVLRGFFGLNEHNSI